MNSMKRILTLLLFLSLSSAHAQQWIPYSQTSQGTQYVDLQRAVVMGGSTAFILDLHDMKSDANDADGKTYRSILYAVEFNCRKEQRRVLSLQRKSESMGNGAVVSEYSQVSEWVEVKTPNDVRLMLAACEQR
jgi:hypothetical protein